MWKANGKSTTLLPFLDSLFPKAETNSRCFLPKQNNLEVNYSPIRISGRWKGGGRGVSRKKYHVERATVRNAKRKRRKHKYKIGTWNF
jgi:hypothetical protein